MKAPDNHSETRTFGFGDRAVCFCQVELRPEPNDAFATTEEALSWGSLEWWVNGQNLCAHYEGTTLVPTVSWYLLPFFEWLAENWDYLFHEQRPPVHFDGANGWESLQGTSQPYRFARLSQADVLAAEEENYEWGRRHRLWSSRDGGLFPDVVIRRDRDKIEVSWGSEPPIGAPTDFRFVTNTGAVRLPAAEFARTLYAVLREAASILRGLLRGSARLRKLEQRVKDLARPVHAEKWLAIMAGLGAKHTAWLRNFRQLRKKLDGTQASLAAWFGGSDNDYLVLIGSCEGALMFGAASPTLHQDDVFTLAEHLVQDSSRAKVPNGLAEHASDIPLEGKPYLSGYGLAEAWGEKSGLWDRSGDAVDIESHLLEYGVRVTDIQLADENIGGVAAARTDFNPLVLVNGSNPRNVYPSGRRFTLAHELCHLLYDCGLGQAVALISGPWAPPGIEQRANAFAAMLLMPSHLVERAFQQVGADIRNPDLNQVLAASKRLRVSPNALVRQLENRHWIDGAIRAQIMSGLSGAREFFEGSEH